MVTRASLAAAIALALAASPVLADDAEVAAHLQAARDHKAALRYAEALAEVEAALAVGRADRDERATLYELAGELTAGMDRPADAEEWFARWLALVPDGTLSDDVSPKLRAALDRARARASTTPPRATPAPPPTPLHRDWRPYAVASVGLAVTGGVFAWRADVAQDEFDRLRADSGAHTFAELDGVRARGERHALLANLGLGLAGATAGAAVGVWRYRPRAPALTVETAGGGASLTVRGRF